MPYAIPKIPVALTNMAWDKQKGTITKILKKKTGVSEAINKYKKVFDTIEWDLFDAAALAKCENTDEVEALKKKAATELNGAVAMCRKLLAELGALAKKLAAEFKKNSLIPSQSRIHLELIAKEAPAFANALHPPLAKCISAMDARKKALTIADLEFVLRTPAYLAAFRKYLADAFCDETLQFWLANQGPGKRSLKTFQTFIPENSKIEVNFAFVPIKLPLIIAEALSRGVILSEDGKKTLGKFPSLIKDTKGALQGQCSVKSFKLPTNGKPIDINPQKIAQEALKAWGAAETEAIALLRASNLPGFKKAVGKYL